MHARQPLAMTLVFTSRENEVIEKSAFPFAQRSKLNECLAHYRIYQTFLNDF